MTPDVSSSLPTIDDLLWNEQGLVVAIAQDVATGEVRMVGYMNRTVLEATLQSCNVTFFSRSRQRLWVKGESSGHVLKLISAHTDCDGDALLLLTEPHGPTCHTGRDSCFFRPLQRSGAITETPAGTAPFLTILERELTSRRHATAGRSYTKSLLEGGADKIGEKLREEAAELAHALAHESEARVASEGADVLFHTLVGLVLRKVPFRAVIEALRQRAGVSGHEEKARRSQG